MLGCQSFILGLLIKRHTSPRQRHWADLQNEACVEEAFRFIVREVDLVSESCAHELTLDL